MSNNLIEDLSIIVFSKNRPLQLHGYIESLLYFSEIPQSSITVLYTHSEEVKYGELIEQYPGISWIKESSFFANLQSVLDASKEYLMFGCDDVIFKDSIDFSLALNALMNDKNLFGFSLRLGENITPVPSELDRSANVLKWNWADCNTAHWDYPWELDSTIYRRADVLQIVSMLNPDVVKNPNYLENEVASKPDRYITKNKLASFKNGKCIVLTVNRVQDDFLNSFDNTINTDIHALDKLYRNNYKIDFLTISKKTNSAIHVGAEFLKLTRNGKPYRNTGLQIKIFIKRVVSLGKRLVSN